jgi:hypothetical protein
MMTVAERCWWISVVDKSFARELLLALLRTAAEQDDVYGERARTVLDSVPEVGFRPQLERLRFFPPAPTWWERWKQRLEGERLPGSAVDWCWESESMIIGATVFTDPRRSYEPQMIERCARWLKREAKPVHGVFVLARTPPEPTALTDPRQAAILGVVLWSDAESRLRAIEPCDPTAVEDWSAILDEMCADPTAPAEGLAG